MTENILVLNENVKIIPYIQKYILWDPESTKWMVVNEDGKRVWEKLKDLRIIDKKMIENIPNIEHFILKLGEKNMIYGFPKENFQNNFKYRYEIKDLFIMLTNRCNLNCIHCIYSSGKKKEKELEKNEIIRIITDFKLMGGITLLLSGGEPFLRKDLIDILQCAYDFHFDTWITTNGTLITEDCLKLLKDLKVNIQVSLDGPDETTNDYIRGKGCFLKAIDGIKKLTSYGIPTKIGVTIMDYNFNKIEDFAKLGEELNVEEVQFFTIIRQGRAKKNKLSISVPNLIRFTQKIFEISSKYKVNLSYERTFYQFLISQYPQKQCGGCGINRISINPIGEVFPCQTMHNHKIFLCSDIKKERLPYIWINNNILNELRFHSVDDSNICKHCIWKYICMGGCISETYDLTGDYKNRSPLCEWYKASLLETMKTILEKDTNNYLYNRYKNISGGGINIKL